MQVKFVDVEGVHTRCLVAGSPSAYPIVMLHGYGGTADVWLRNIDVLGDEFYVVAVDMLGSGFTRPPGPFSGPPQAATVAHLCRLADVLGFGQFCAMGSSYGSLIAALTYFARPQQVNKLVLNGSATCFNSDEQLVVALTKVLENFAPVMDNPTTEACREAAIKQVYDPASVPEEMMPVMATAYAQPWSKQSWETGLRGLLDVGAFRDQQVRDRLEQLDVDTLVVWGRQDPGARYESAVEGVRRMPRGRLETFEQCGHKPMYEHAARYNDLMRDFLRVDQATPGRVAAAR